MDFYIYTNINNNVSIFLGILNVIPGNNSYVSTVLCNLQR